MLTFLHTPCNCQQVTHISLYKLAYMHLPQKKTITGTRHPEVITCLRTPYNCNRSHIYHLLPRRLDTRRTRPLLSTLNIPIVATSPRSTYNTAIHHNSIRVPAYLWSITRRGSIHSLVEVEYNHSKSCIGDCEIK